MTPCVKQSNPRHLRPERNGAMRNFEEFSGLKWKIRRKNDYHPGKIWASRQRRNRKKRPNEPIISDVGHLQFGVRCLGSKPIIEPFFSIPRTSDWSLLKGPYSQQVKIRADASRPNHMGGRSSLFRTISGNPSSGFYSASRLASKVSTSTGFSRIRMRLGGSLHHA